MISLCVSAQRQNFLSKLERNKSGSNPSFDGGTSQEDVEPATARCCFLSHNKHHLLRFSPMAISFPPFKIPQTREKLNYSTEERLYTSPNEGKVVYLARKKQIKKEIKKITQNYRGR